MQYLKLKYDLLNCSNVSKAIIFGFFLRLVVAAWNGFWGPSFGADADAAGFHIGALGYARGEDFTDFAFSNIYIYVLGTFYRWTFESLFLGSCLSCIAWTASAILLYRMMNMLKINGDNQCKAMIIYSIMPSVVILTGVTLREGYQLLAVNLVVFASLSIYYYRAYWHILFLLFGLILMGAMHVALLPAGFFILAIALSNFFLNLHDSRALVKLALLFLVLLGVGYGGSTLFLDAVFNGNNLDLVSALQARQDSWQQSSRASYAAGLRISSDLDLLWFIPVALFHYFFQPMIWRASTVFDWALLLENLLRCILLFKVVIALFALPTPRKILLLLVFSSFLLIEIVWAVGTINWGTAARHHIPAFGLLVLSAFAGNEQGATVESK